MVRQEQDARLIGYGGMLMESFVAVMAMCAAAVLDPGIYFAINVPLGDARRDRAGRGGDHPRMGLHGDPGGRSSSWPGRSAKPRCWAAPAARRRWRWAWPPSSAAPSAQHLLALWYHFAIMFEALFILTTIDAGTRVGRFMLQELAGHVWEPLGRTSWYPSMHPGLGAGGRSAGATSWFRACWIRWAASIRCGRCSASATSSSPRWRCASAPRSSSSTGKARYAWVTLAPLAWLLTVTLTASWQKIFSPERRLGFLADARALEVEIANGTMEAARGARLIFNDHLNAVVAGTFVLIVLAVVISSAREWLRILWGGREPVMAEAPIVESAYAG